MPDTQLDLPLHELLHQREWLNRLAAALVRDPHAAEDAAQQTWLQALRAKGPLGSGRAWLSAVLGNVVRAGHRSDRRRGRREGEVAAHRPATAHAAAEANERFETQRIVAAAVQALDEPFRSTVLLHHFEGMSLAAIGKSQDVPAGTVRWRLFRAHELLRAALERTYGGQDWRRALLVLSVPARRAALLSPIASLLLTAVVLVGAFAWLAAGPGGGAPAPHAAVAAARDDAATNDRADVAQSARDVPARREPASVPAEPPTTGDLRVTVRTRILGADGAPIAGAHLQLAKAKLDSRELKGPLLAPFTSPAYAGPDGDVTLELRAPGALLALLPQRRDAQTVGTLVFAARADGHADREVEVHLGNGDDRRLEAIVLNAVATIRGRVLAADGRPVPGARVSLLRPPFPAHCDVLAAAQHDPDGKPTVTTDPATGAFELPGVSTGLAMLWASRTGHTSAWRLLDIPAARADCSDVVLPAGAPEKAQARAEILGVAMPSICVLVVDQHGDVLENAVVDNRITFGDGGISGGSAHTSGTGRAQLPGFGDRRVTRIDLAVTGGDRTLGGVALPNVPLVDGEIRVALAPAAAIEVHASSQDGRAIAAFTVAWRAQEPALGEGFATGTHGVATLAAPFAPATLSVRAAGHAPASLPFVPGETTTPLQVALAPRRGITGIVTAGGEPVAGASVTLLRCGAPLLLDGLRSEGRRGGARAETDRDGRFRIDHGDAEVLQLRVHANDHCPALTGRHDYDAALGWNDVAIELDAGGAIEGTVRDRAGTVVPRALVAIHDFHGDARTVFADSEGRFRGERLRPGGYEVRLVGRTIDRSWSTEGTVPAECAPPQADCHVKHGATTAFDLITDRCRVTGSLLGTGVDPSHWRARLQRAHDGQRSCDDVILRNDGAFELTSSSTGPHDLRLDAPGGPLGNVSVHLRLELTGGDYAVSVPLALAPFGARAAGAHGTRDGSWAYLKQETATQRVLAHVHVDPSTLDFRAPLAPVGEVTLVEGSGAKSREVGRFVVPGR